MKDDTTPATKADIRHLDGRIDKLDAKIDRMAVDLRGEMREMAKGLHNSIDQVLTVLVNMNNRLTPAVQNHEKRITKPETLAGVSALSPARSTRLPFQPFPKPLPHPYKKGRFLL